MKTTPAFARLFPLLLCLGATPAARAQAFLAAEYGCTYRDALRHDSLDMRLEPVAYAAYKALEDSSMAVERRLTEVERPILEAAKRDSRNIIARLQQISDRRDDDSVKKVLGDSLHAITQSLLNGENGVDRNRANFLNRQTIIAGDYFMALARPREPIPAPGMDACEVIWARGAPDRVTRTQITGGYQSASWWYEEPDHAHLVTLRPDGHGRWLVDTVVW